MNRHRRRTACATAVVLLSSAGLSACSSLAPPVAQPVALTVTATPVAEPPTLTATPPAVVSPVALYTAYPGPSRAPAPTATEPPVPDEHGYFPAPPDRRTVEEYPYLNELAIADRGPNARFVADLQAMLDAHDVVGLAALVKTDGGSKLGFGWVELAGPVQPDEMAAAFGRLFAAGSNPIVQGYLTSRYTGEYVGSLELHVFSTGWRGSFGLPDRVHVPGGPFPRDADDIAVWHFYTEGNQWIWRAWSGDEDYYATVRSVAAEEQSEDRRLTYHIARPRALWPTPTPPAGRPPALAIPPAMTPWPPTAEPDAQGYFPAPPTDPTDEAFLYSIEQETPDGGPAGAIVSKLQALLDQGDAEGLAAMVGSNPNDRLYFCGPFNYIPTSCPGSIPSAEAQRTLQRLFDAGSQPIVQGYFAPFNSSELGAPPDTFYVVSTGWRGAFDFGDVEVPTPSPDHPLDPMPTAATDTVVWRVVIGDKGPRWDNWMWCDHGLYEGTVDALAWEVDSGDELPMPYHVVRPADP